MAGARRTTERVGVVGRAPGFFRAHWTRASQVGHSQCDGAAPARPDERPTRAGAFTTRVPVGNRSRACACFRIGLSQAGSKAGGACLRRSGFEA